MDINFGFFSVQMINLSLLAFPVVMIVGMLLWARRRRRGDHALDVLKARLARGDIGEAEYVRLRALLRDETLEKRKRDEETVDSVSSDPAPDDTMDAHIIDADELRRLRDRWQ